MECLEIYSNGCEARVVATESRKSFHVVIDRLGNFRLLLCTIIITSLNLVAGSSLLSICLTHNIIHAHARTHTPKR